MGAPGHNVGCLGQSVGSMRGQRPRDGWVDGLGTMVLHTHLDAHGDKLGGALAIPDEPLGQVGGGGAQGVAEGGEIGRILGDHRVACARGPERSRAGMGSHGQCQSLATTPPPVGLAPKPLPSRSHPARSSLPAAPLART